MSKLCRICFKLLDKKGFSTKKFNEVINKAFFINTTTDDENIHPTQICQKCYLYATMAIKQNTTASINPLNNRNAHFDDNCQIYDTVQLISKGVIGLQKIKKTHKKASWRSTNIQKALEPICSKHTKPVNSTQFYPLKY